jgi:anti-anti-sigma factor
VPLTALSIERHLTPPTVRFVLSGELDLSVVGNVETVMADEIAALDGDVCVDLAGLGFIGFAGVDLFVELARRLSVSRRRLDVVATNRTVDRALELAGVKLVRSAGSVRSIVPPGAMPAPSAPAA